MTTFDALAVGWRAAKAAKRSERRALRALPAIKRIGAIVADSALIVIGLGVLTTAAFLFNTEVGLVAAALSCFALDFELTH